MRVDQSLFGFRSEHLIETRSARLINMRTPHVGLLHVLGAMDAARGERYISAEAARGRAFIDPNMAGRSPGLRSCFSVRPSFESRTMIVPHQSPSAACQTELAGSSSSSTAAGDQRNLLMSVATRSSWPLPLRWCLAIGTVSHCTRTLPIPGHPCSEAQSLPTAGFGCAMISRVKPRK